MYSEKRAFIRTFGCRANLSDSEKISGMLSEMGYTITEDIDKANLIIFNTCAIRENAQTKVFGNIGSLIHQKRQNPNLIIAVCGCMVQQEQVKNELYKTFPFVDLIFGTYALQNLPVLLNKVIEGKKRVVDINSEVELGGSENLPQKRNHPFKADVPIIYGCDNFCSYCIVPYVRGRERSRMPNSIINEVKGLVNSGFKEITLLGQNVNSYGKEHGITFSELLKKLDEIEGEFIIRFMTSHPKDLSFELIDTIAESEKISRHLHLPVQSGSDKILALMNRKYTIKQYKDIIEYARKRIKNISITTDIIVGFPSETRSDFEETLDIIRTVQFDSAYTFIYSRREGTNAVNLPDPISDSEKSAWFSEMLELLNGISETTYERYIGKTLRVLCDERERGGKMFSGRSREGVIVNFDINHSNPVNTENMDIIGKFVNIKITDSLKWAVIGELI